MEIYLICLAVALVGGLMLSRLTKLVNLPAVTAYLVAGLLLGPFALGRLNIPGLGFQTLEQVELRLEQTQRALSALNPEERLVLIPAFFFISSYKVLKSDIIASYYLLAAFTTW